MKQVNKTTLNDIMINLKNVCKEVLDNTSLFALNIKDNTAFPICVITEKSDTISSDLENNYHNLSIIISIIDTSYTKCNTHANNILQALKTCNIGARIKQVESLNKELVTLGTYEAFKCDINLTLNYTSELFTI